MNLDNVTGGEPSSSVLNLDEMILSDCEFVLLGVKRVMKPLELEAYFKLNGALASLKEIASQTKDAKLLAQAYFIVFSSCVEPISLDDVLGMSQAQVGALVTLLIRRQYGEDLSKVYDQKKKTPRVSTSQSWTLRRSWQKLLYFLGGFPERS